MVGATSVSALELGPRLLSEWIDGAPDNRDRDREALTWHRVMKVAEEAGEVTTAMIGWTGGNPRKGVTHKPADVLDELLDVALSALSGIEHLTGNSGYSLDLLCRHVAQVCHRAGIDLDVT